uniref:Uncharacterized protein n=1 Tax=Bursaphelenchus xylophilus TaxID=6326 RepID=A0A1I7S7Z1_BURXY
MSTPSQVNPPSFFEDSSRVRFSPQVEPRPRVWPPRQGIDLTEVRHELILYGEIIAIVCLAMAFTNLALYPWVVKGHTSFLYHYEHILKLNGSRIEELTDLIRNIELCPYENMTSEDMIQSISYTTPCGISNRFPIVPNDTDENCGMSTNFFHGYIKMSNFEEYNNKSGYISSRALQHYHKYDCCFTNRLFGCPCGYLAANATVCLAIPTNGSVFNSDDETYCNGIGTYRNIKSQTPECLEYKKLFQEVGTKETTYCSFEYDQKTFPFIQGVCVYEKTNDLMTWMF